MVYMLNELGSMEPVPERKVAGYAIYENGKVQTYGYRTRNEAELRLIKFHMDGVVNADDCEIIPYYEGEYYSVEARRFVK